MGGGKKMEGEGDRRAEARQRRRPPDLCGRRSAEAPVTSRQACRFAPAERFTAPAAELQNLAEVIRSKRKATDRC